MPTIILLDVSLSMSSYISEDVKKSKIDIISKSLSNFFDYLSKNCKYEHTAFIIFSSLYEILCKFTRDYQELKNVIRSLKTYDKTMFRTAFQCVENLVQEEWGLCVPINVILITDGVCGIGDDSLKDVLKSNQISLPFMFPCHFSILLLSTEDDLKTNKQYFEELIKLNNNKGELIVPDVVSENGVHKTFERIVHLHYERHEVELQCGEFKSTILLSPSVNLSNSFLSTTNQYGELFDTKYTLSKGIQVLGFIDLQDLANPPQLSRHVISPVPPDDASNKENHGFQPSFCVLLHGSLKMEKMAAIVKLSESWYGMLYSWADSKKKSTLMLSIFEPGLAIPWLGEFKNLGPAFELPVNPYQFDEKENAEDTPFPVTHSTRRSYHAQSNAVWIKSSGLQSDVQKLLRYAKKLPDKQSAFFKEVNKLRRAGVMYGFHELLNELAAALESEGAKTTQEVNVQLCHVAKGLRNSPFRDIEQNIVAINMFRKKSNDS